MEWLRLLLIKKNRVLRLPQMEDWESIVAEIVDWMGVRFWEWTRVSSVTPPHVEDAVTASCMQLSMPT